VVRILGTLLLLLSGCFVLLMVWFFAATFEHCEGALCGIGEGLRPGIILFMIGGAVVAVIGYLMRRSRGGGQPPP
jgi:hypothetical protein